MQIANNDTLMHFGTALEIALPASNTVIIVINAPLPTGEGLGVREMKKLQLIITRILSPSPHGRGVGGEGKK